MEEKLSGIVLGGINFGENDKILSIFTLEKGTVSAKIKGVKKAGAKLKFASEPFCFAEFILSSRAGKNSVIGASLIDSFYPVREDVKKYYAGSVILEFVKKFVYESIISPEVFMAVADSLKALAYGEEDYATILSRFLIFGLEKAGYALSNGECADCGKKIRGRAFFNYSVGGFFCAECLLDGSREISVDTLNAFIAIKNGELPQFESAKRVLKLLDFYISQKTETDLKSLKELIKI